MNDSCAVVGADWPLTALTSMFMHGGVFHLGTNMLFLWIFGNNVEDALGPARFLVFYLLGGLAATALQTRGHARDRERTRGADPEPRRERRGLGRPRRLLRAAAERAGADAVLLRRHLLPAGAAGLDLPRRLLRPPGVGGGFQLQHPPEGGGTAVFAHIGGIAFGFLAVKLFQSADHALRPRY